ncbi:MAG: adenosylcobinamide-GDP ribazoletransferase [Candidatus Syntrophopropionicum ammoniitolerans]
MLLATILTAAVCGLVLGVDGAILMLSGGLIAYLVGQKVNRVLDGLTGDIYGFINELSEVLLLLIAYPLLKILG